MKLHSARVLAFGHAPMRGLLIWLGVKLHQRGITAARWAQLALVWLSVGVVILGITTFYNAGRPATLRPSSTVLKPFSPHPITKTLNPCFIRSSMSPSPAG